MTNLWTPRNYSLPALDDNLTVPQLCDAIKDDPMLVDRLFLPRSWKLTPFQRLTIKAIHEHQIIFIQVGRGGTKSYTVARACLDQSLVNQINVVYTGPSFRQAMLPWDYVKTFIEENSLEMLPFNLGRELNGKITASNLMARIRLKNGSRHVALPMGDGKKLRGQRAHILVCDEFFDMDAEMFNKHIVPFLLRPVQAGTYRSKLIMMTSAETQDCYAYHYLINTMLPKVRDGNLKYCVLDWRAEDVAASGIILEPEIADMLLHNTGGNTEERERLINNRWTSSGGQFFPSNLVSRMENPSTHVEDRAASGIVYGFAVDVASSPTGDNFVIQVCKFPGNRRMEIVHSFWAKGLNADEMAWLIHQYDAKFQPQWIVMDKGGGGTHVASSLSKRKLVMRNNEIKEIANPILLHDEIGAISGQRKLILNKPTDDLVRTAFAGDRARGGEYINAEDIFVHLMYDGFRNLLFQEPCPVQIPVYGASTDDDEAVVDKIHQSVRELKNLSYKYQLNSDGTKYVVRSKLHRVPMYVWKSSNKDGAVSLAYAYILYNLIYPSERGSNANDYEPIVVPIIPGNDAEHHLRSIATVEREPGQLFDPMTGRFI